MATFLGRSRKSTLRVICNINMAIEILFYKRVLFNKDEIRSGIQSEKHHASKTEFTQNERRSHEKLKR